jgi:hypothetical protein
MKEDQARFYMRYDEELRVLIVEVTQNVAFSAMKIIRIHLWPEVEHMQSETIDCISDNGHEYKNVIRYIIPAYVDRVERFFDAAKHVLAKNIKESIPHSDN